MESFLVVRRNFFWRRRSCWNWHSPLFSQIFGNVPFPLFSRPLIDIVRGIWSSWRRCRSRWTYLPGVALSRRHSCRPWFGLGIYASSLRRCSLPSSFQAYWIRSGLVYIGGCGCFFRKSKSLQSRAVVIDDGSACRRRSVPCLDVLDRLMSALIVHTVDDMHSWSLHHLIGEHEEELFIPCFHYGIPYLLYYCYEINLLSNSMQNRFGFCYTTTKTRTDRKSVVSW